MRRGSRDRGGREGSAGPGSPFGLIGQSPAIAELVRRIERVAPINVPVLIRGGSGTGKELVANAIQRLSRRGARRFEIVNCGALPRELLLSELFGHERGAFTGAVTAKVGLLSLADGGTLFLDEVAELAPDAQAMLLRFLQSGEIRPVGSTRTSRVDVRVISATHRDLEQAMLRGPFREDLYYRLCDVILEVPSLRARREDIPLLVEHFRAQFNERFGLGVSGLAPEALAAMMAYPWPGNVRALEKVLKEAMILRGDGLLQKEDLRIWDARGFAADMPGGPAGRYAPLEKSAPPDERCLTALRMAHDRGAVTRRELARESGVSGDTARQELTTLTRLGYLRRVGEGRSTRYVLR
jgi:two-component system, NtrC family, response regulator HydG